MNLQGKKIGGGHGCKNPVLPIRNPWDLSWLGGKTAMQNPHPLQCLRRMFAGVNLYSSADFFVGASGLHSSICFLGAGTTNRFGEREKSRLRKPDWRGGACRKGTGKKTFLVPLQGQTMTLPNKRWRCQKPLSVQRREGDGKGANRFSQWPLTAVPGFTR